METAKTWPENSWPTAEQLADWLARCTDAERVAFAESVLDRAQQLGRALVARAV